MMTASKHALLTLFLALVFSSSLAYSGKLSDFESKSTKKNKDKEDSDNGDSLFFLLDIVGELLPSSKKEKKDKTPKPISQSQVKDEDLVEKKFFGRFELGYQRVNSDLRAWNGQLQLGFHSYVFHYRQEQFHELLDTQPATDHLKVYQYLALLQSSQRKGEPFKVQFGLGGLTIEGKERSSGFSMALPMEFHFHKHFSFDLRPSWSWINNNRIQDYELRLSAHYRALSFHTGYRWFYSEDAHLNGLVLGTSVSF